MVKALSAQIRPFHTSLPTSGWTWATGSIATAPSTTTFATVGAAQRCLIGAFFFTSATFTPATEDVYLRFGGVIAARFKDRSGIRYSPKFPKTPLLGVAGADGELRRDTVLSGNTLYYSIAYLLLDA